MIPPCGVPTERIRYHIYPHKTEENLFILDSLAGTGID